MKNLIASIILIITLVSCDATKKDTSDMDVAKEKSTIIEKYWKLETLFGKQVAMVEHQEREAFFRLTADGRLVGFSGCNALSGGYTLNDGLRISFEHVATTLKVCDEAINESQFLEVFNTADNYSLINNGEQLSLNKAKMAPLAVFQAVVVE